MTNSCSIACRPASVCFCAPVLNILRSETLQRTFVRSPFMTTSLTASRFIESILQLRPTLAVFDCDGTLWSGDVGERFFDWELRNGIFSDATVGKMRSRYAEYKAGKVSEDE